MIQKQERHPKYNEFLVACCSSFSRAEYLLRRYPELLETKEGVGETPLHYLAIENRCEAVEFLIQKGAQVDAQTHFQATPLIHAARLGWLEMVGLLLKAGADPGARSDLEGSALHSAAGAYKQNAVAVIKLLLDHGANVDIRQPIKGTPLMMSVKSGNIELVRLLLSRGADPNAVSFGESVLHIAAASTECKAEMIDLLLQAGADPQVLDDDGETPYQVAIAAGNLVVADALVRATGEK